jgi:hypothetical protein
MKNTKIAQLNAFADKVDVQFIVLGPLVMHHVHGHVDRRDIITVCDRGLVDATVQLAEELS